MRETGNKTKRKIIEFNKSNHTENKTQQKKNKD